MKQSQNDIERKAVDALKSCLGRVPFLGIESIEQAHCVGDMKPDISAIMKIGNKKLRIVMDVTGNGQPKMARSSAYRFFRYRQDNPNTYCVFSAPYISPEAADICLKENIGYIDLAGNCRLSFGKVHIEQEGISNPFTQKRELRSLYSPKSERVLRVLLSNPQMAWRVQPLAKEAKVSLGQVSNVKRLLEDREWLIKSERGLKLCAPDLVLAEWGANYNFSRNTNRNYYSPKGIDEIEADLTVICRLKRIPCVFTGFSAIAKYLPSPRYGNTICYVGKDMEKIAGQLSFKESSEGSNVTLISPYDEGVMYDSRQTDEINAATPIQLYLDLLNMKERGREAATTLLYKVIKKTWYTGA